MTLSICAEQKSQYVIVSAETTMFAAGELQRYVEKVTGVELPLADAANGPAVRLVIEGTSEERDRFRISADGDDLVISGANVRSVLYGVYSFLERFCGVRFYAPDFEVTPGHSACRRFAIVSTASA